jgi:hypothetical protein
MRTRRNVFTKPYRGTKHQVALRRVIRSTQKHVWGQKLTFAALISCKHMYMYTYFDLYAQLVHINTDVFLSKKAIVESGNLRSIIWNVAKKVVCFLEMF